MKYKVGLAVVVVVVVVGGVMQGFQLRKYARSTEDCNVRF